LYGFEYVGFSTILDAFEALSSSSSDDIPSLEYLMQRVDRALHQARGRVRGLERELAQASDPDLPRGLANLLLARLGEIERGAAEARVTGFHGEPVTIPLDPSKSPQENADDLYREAGRLERAREKLPPLLEEAGEKVQGLEELREDLRDGRLSPEEAESRLPGEAGRPGVPGRTEDARLPYLRFRSSGGLEIRVGRGSSENDALTFRHSRPDDVWLHAREAAGAHVVLRWDKPEAPPGRDLTEAAVLAALNSQARSAGVVPVDWTRRKYVRKPRGARPGTVLPRETRTVFVEPDPELPGRLRFED
jgi:predicted ribosome quality control (RQC) complex YloA/Tae2 family protein